MLAPRRISLLAFPTLLPVVLGALLASCSEGALFTGGTTPRDAAPEAAEIRDASVFQKTANALWDGRPSLGGIWVAHPDATTPERVEIRNDETGQVIQAALFRRERDFPGPPFQLSSDAAVALRVTAGTPTAVTVTALRREPVAPPPEPEIVDAAPADVAEDPAVVDADVAIDAGPTPESATGDDIALTDAAAETGAGGSAGSFLFGEKPQNTGVNAPTDEGLVAETTGEIPAAEVDPVLPASEDQAALDANDPAADPFASEFAVEPEPAGGSAGSAGSTPGNKPTLVNDAGEPIALDDPSLEPITATEILSAPLPEAAADVVEPEATPEPVADIEPEAADSAAEPAITSDLERPFVQVASGSTKANVDELAAKLANAGLPATVRETMQDGQPLYYVVVGPYTSEADLAAALARIRELGYSEAFIAKG